MNTYQAISSIMSAGVRCGLPIKRMRYALGSKAIEINFRYRAWLCDPETLLDQVAELPALTIRNFMAAVRKRGVLVKRMK